MNYTKFILVVSGTGKCEALFARLNKIEPGGDDDGFFFRLTVRVQKRDNEGGGGVQAVDFVVFPMDRSEDDGNKAGLVELRRPWPLRGERQ